MKVGDTVKVIDKGKTYSIYDFMAEKMGLPNFCRGGTPFEGTKGLITHKIRHPLQDCLIYGVKIDNQDYIMGEFGIKVTEKSPKSVISGNYNI